MGMIKSLLALKRLSGMLGKSPYKSWTVWGLLLFSCSGAGIEVLCPGTGALTDTGGGSWAAPATPVPDHVCAILTEVMEKAGVVLSGLGIRRKLV